MRLFSQRESEFFESMFLEKLQPIRARHFAEVDRIHCSNVQHKLNTRQGHFLPNELEFCKTIEAEIQFRKDVQQATASSSSINYNSIYVGENRGNIQQAGIGNTQIISGRDDEVK